MLILEDFVITWATFLEHFCLFCNLHGDYNEKRGLSFGEVFDS